MKKINLGVMTLANLFLLAGIALAHPCGAMMMQGSGADSDERKAITGKYTEEFDSVQMKIEAKREELRKARADDATTLGQLKTLRSEMNKIKQEHRALIEKVDAELAETFGGPEFTCPCGMMADGMKKGMMGAGMHKGSMGSGMMNGDMHKGMMSPGMHKGMMGPGMHKGMMGAGMMDHDDQGEMSDEDLFSEEKVDTKN